MLGFWGVLLVLLVNYTLWFNREVVYTNTKGGGEGGFKNTLLYKYRVIQKNVTVETNNTALRL